MTLSVVSTLYRSAPSLEEFYGRVKQAAEALTKDYEIVLVNDGSPDDSLALALALYERDARVRVVDLSRNFGHHKAIMTGLAHARGDMVFLIDSDLEEEPELLARFYEERRRTGADVVYGVQEQRKGSWFERWSGETFFTLFNLFSNYPLPHNLITVRLMTRRYVNALIAHRERETVVAGLWVLTGFLQVALAVKKHSRSPTTYGFGRKIGLLVQSVTAFSDKPLTMIFYMGCAISGVAVAAALYLIIRRVFFGVLLEGWPSLIVSIWLLGGATIFCIGILGIYLSKIFIETKQRPYTIVRQLYERGAGPS